MSNFKDEPRKVYLNDVCFTEEDIAKLKASFPALSMTVLAKKDIRGSVFQKAIIAGAVAYPTMSTDDNASLHLTEDGKKLIGKI